MINLALYQFENRKVRITCVDDQILDGHILSVDDDEESGFGEMGITLVTDYGRYIGIGQSEIKTIDIIH